MQPKSRGAEPAGQGSVVVPRRLEGHLTGALPRVQAGDERVEGGLRVRDAQRAALSVGCFK